MTQEVPREQFNRFKEEEVGTEEAKANKETEMAKKIERRLILRDAYIK